MANKSLIGDLLLTPSQVRAKEDKERLTRGLAQAQLFNQGNTLGGVGGMFASFGASQAAQTGQNISDAFRRAGTALGVDMASPEEKQAAAQQQAMSGIQMNNLANLQKRRKMLVDANADPRAIMMIDEAIVKAQAKDQEKLGLQKAANLILTRYNNPEAAEAVASGSVDVKDMMDALEKDNNLTVIGNQAINRRGETIKEVAPEKFEVLSPTDAEQLGFPADGVYQRNTKTGKVSQVNRPNTQYNDYGDIPDGYRLIRTQNADGSETLQYELIEGHPVAIELQKEAEKKERSAASWAVQNDFMVRNLQELITYAKENPEDVAGRTPRFVQDALRIPLFGALFAASDAASFQSEIQTISSNIGFDRLQQMREESPTGGALGQVAVRELLDLQAVLGNLQVNQKPEQMIANLEQVLERYVTNAVIAAQAYDTATLSKYGLGQIAAMSAAIDAGTLDPQEIIDQATNPKEGKKKITFGDLT